MSARWPCPCCGYRVLPEGPGRWAWCDICGWEDDPSQLRWPLSAVGPNGTSLVAAQASYVRLGAASERRARNARAPRADEQRDEDWRPLDTGRDWFEANPPPPGTEVVWPVDRAALYWWRPTYWNGQPDPQPVTYDPAVPEDALVLELLERVPEVRPVVERVERQYGEPAAFSVCSDLSGFVVNAWARGEVELALRMVTVLDGALANGDEHCHNCVAVGFLENDAWHAADTGEFTDRWPPRIAAQLDRQRRGWSEGAGSVRRRRWWSRR